MAASPSPKQLVSLKQFYRAHESALGWLPDPEKLDAINADPTESLHMIAGPGTGKTACLAARVLKLIYVDQVPPTGIIATTFTKRAATELRSRILGWGFKMKEALEADPKVSGKALEFVQSVDVNQVLIGTIDSLCMDLLTLHRGPGDQPPIDADEYVAKTIMLRKGLFAEKRHKSKRMDAELKELDARTNSYGWFVSRKVEVLQSIADRRRHDEIEMRDWAKDPSSTDGKYGRAKICESLEAYDSALADRGMLDYAGIEFEALKRLREGKLDDFRNSLQVILVDEYQDTNLLQEDLYFELAQGCNGALTVVGDDDQSLYRFRGATVELFVDFAKRYRKKFSREPKPIYLHTNHRSTPEIIKFTQNYATLDRSYSKIRAKGKPPLDSPPGANSGLPILGMFRDSVEELAIDLADLIDQTFRGNGYRLENGMTIQGNTLSGDVGDVAILRSSPQEENASGKTQLPGFLRDELLNRPNPIHVFNPRGEPTEKIPLIQQLCGLLLQCIDPDGSIEETRFRPNDVKGVIADWRNVADAELRKSSSLMAYVSAWQGRLNDSKWPPLFSLLELLYDLSHWFPESRLDPTGQLYLELLCRQIGAAQEVGGYNCQILTYRAPDDTAHNQRSVRQVIENFIIPAASGILDINEELIEDFPRDQVPILSIHQSKGLEFPMVIVDVGSAFKTNHAKQRFRRFPDEPGAPQAQESLLRPFSPLGPPNRGDLDRAFDDLYRLYFVAFSRAMNVLLLVGTNKSRPDGAIMNVALGWNRKGQSTWADTPPYMEI